MNLQTILLKYWGFSYFRPLQEDIIRSVLEGKDTLALLPTGGGKSLCYQVPAMASEGICMVVTPLIALMKDQVQSLRNKGIKAVCIYHGLSSLEIETALNNCVYGDIKFLYLSPERLTTATLRSRLEKMRVNLLAVDEAHCISQWGYDFRPPYLRIAEIRQWIPTTPVLALTATATTQVVKDIQEKLAFRAPREFRKSFERKNLAYMVFREENKMGRLLKICRKLGGTGIVYVRNRKRSREIAEQLLREGIHADFYHAGLTTPERDLKQNSWMKERTQVIVSTNAFGMGIDKPNVRFVVHMDLPDSPEAYFQEAGRAGRDGHKAFAVLLYNPADLSDLERFHERSFPEVGEIKKVYNCLGNYFQLAVGSGKDQSMPFDLPDFAKKYGMQPFLVYNALNFLEREGYLALSEAMANPSRIMFLVDNEELYRFQVANPGYDGFIRLLLRSYSGLFSEFARIREDEIGKRAGTATPEVKKRLQELHAMQILHYKPQNEQAQITFLQPRLSESDMVISREVYHDRKAFAKQRLRAMKAYATSETICRSSYLLGYFGETGTGRCGHCDICLELNKAGVSSYEFEQIIDMIRPLLEKAALSPAELIAEADMGISEEKILGVIRYLKDNNRISEDSEGLLQWRPSG